MESKVKESPTSYEEQLMNNSKNALVRVRETFLSAETSLTLPMIRERTNLSNSAISMALCHLYRNRYVSRELTERTHERARKTIWSYRYHPEKLPKQEI